MPELPEVETVRLGLGAGPGRQSLRVRRAAARRFALSAAAAFRRSGSTGRNDRGARPPRQISARAARRRRGAGDASRHDRALQHRPRQWRRRARAEAFAHPSSADIPKHEHIVFHLGDGAAVRYSDARRFGLMDLIPAERARQARAVQGPRHRAVKRRLHARMACRPAQGQGHIDQGRAARSEADRGARQYLCLRGALPRQASRRCGSPARSRPRPASRRAKTKALVERRQGGARRGDQGRRLHRCATIAAPTATLGRFQHRFKVYGREGKPCPRKGCSGTVRRIVQSGRSTFYCPTCQR